VSKVQTPSHSEALRLEFKLRELLEELRVVPIVFPTVPIADLSGATIADTGYPREAMGLVAPGAGGAGTNGQAMCVATGGRGKVYKVTAALVTKPSAGNIQLRSSAADPTAQVQSGNNNFMDQRVSGTRPDLFIGASTPLTAAIEGTAMAQIRYLGADTILLPLGIILGETGFVNIVNVTANEAFEVSYYWTEYLLEDR